VPQPVVVANARGRTLVTNAGCNGKYLALLDLDVRGGRVQGYQYRLLPVFSELLPADGEMAAYIDHVRVPHIERLAEKLAVTEGLLYRRGNFNGTFDQLILDALMAEQSAEIAFSPGFRWGPTLLPGQTITMEQLLAQTAITYPSCTVSSMKGEAIKSILEDLADNLFNPDPYYQQGGDMVRVGGMTYAIDPAAAVGHRIGDMRLHGRPLSAGKAYKVAGWAPMAEVTAGEPVWEVVARYLRRRKTLAPRVLNSPRIARRHPWP
jgi:S-sulfosulfanyl-L-cysteine sulfohydrolase